MFDNNLWDTAKNSIVAVEGKYSQEFQNVSVNNPDQVKILRYAAKEDT